MPIRLAYSAVLLASCVVCLGLLASNYRRRGRAFVGAEFSALIGACIVYAAGYVAELYSSTLEGAFAAVRFEYLGLAYLPSLWILFALRFAGRGASPALSSILLAYPVAIWIVLATSPSHSLYYVDMYLRTEGPFPVLSFGRGPLYWVNQVYRWAAIVVGGAILLDALRRSPPSFRAQIAFVVAAALFPLVLSVVYVAGLVPYGLDAGPLGFGLSVCFFALGSRRSRFLDLVPVAREKVLECLDDGVIVIDAEGRIVDSNPAARSVFGRGELETGRPFAEFCSSRGELAPLAEPGSNQVEFSCPLGEDEGKRFKARSFPVGADGDRRLGTAILVTDVTETARLVAKLDELASVDALTELLNRRRFFELASREVEMAKRSGAPLAVCIADLDLFKSVNDSYGHAAGDAVLREAAARFRSCLRTTDLVCRYGGEEFAFLFPGSDLEEGRAVAERLRCRLCTEAIEVEGRGIAVSASFGVAGGRAPAAGEGLDAFLRAADRALYKAKDDGRNRVVDSAD